MGHYDECRTEEGYCGGCGAGPGNVVNGQCQFCKPGIKPSKPTLEKVNARTTTHACATKSIDVNTERDDKLTLSALTQLLSYAQHVEDIGWSYGNEDQFEHRHKLIVQWITQQIGKHSRGK